MAQYTKLVREAVDHYVKRGDYLPLPALPPELMRQQGCYVTILENPGRRVRAMHGEVMPRHPTLAEELVVNAVLALSGTPSWRVRRADLPHLGYSVALLGPLQRVADPEHLDPERYGLYVRSDQGKTALLLPQRAGVETPEDQIATAMRESGVNVRNEAVTLYRFDVTHYDD